MSKTLKICGKELSLPIIQGGMGIRISLSNLAKAAIKNGVAATMSIAQVGFLRSEFKKDPMKANKEEMINEISKVRKEYPDGLLGVNLMHAMNHYGEYATFLSNQDIDYIVSGAGLPLDLPKYIKDSKVKGAFIISSAKGAKVMLRSWLRKHNYVPAFIVVEGPLAGGHLGFTKEEMASGKVKNLEEIVPEVVKVVREFEETYDCKIPVIAGGGVHDGFDINTMLEVGADGVQMATRFIGTHECDASDEYKNMLVNAKESDMVGVASPAGLPGRAVKNYLTETLKETKLKVNYCVNCLKPCVKIGIPYCITEQLGNASAGDNTGLIFTGAKGYLINQLVSFDDIINEIRTQINKKYVFGG